MNKRGFLSFLVVAAVLFSTLSVTVFAHSEGDACWAVTSNANGCTYGTYDCGCCYFHAGSTHFGSGCECVGQTETCNPAPVGSDWTGPNADGYTTTCDFNGCDYPLFYDCPSPSCSNSREVYYSYIPHVYFAGDYPCEQYDRCANSCCPAEQTCQGSPATCQPIKKPCPDNDKDGYGNPGQDNCPSGSATDCNDANSAIHPGAAESLNSVDDNCNGQVDENICGNSVWESANGEDCDYGAE